MISRDENRQKLCLSPSSHTEEEELTANQLIDLLTLSRSAGFFRQSVTLKVTHADMKTIIRSEAVDAVRPAGEMHLGACVLSDRIIRFGTGLDVTASWT